MTFMQSINVFLLAAAVAMMLPIGMFCLECLAAVLPRCRRRLPSPSDWNVDGGSTADSAVSASGDASRNDQSAPSTAVLIPAHDEQLVIGQTLEVIVPMLSSSDRVVVVADNCSDRTAEIARSAGAEAVERTDPSRRGKGYALQRGIEYLSDNPPEVVVIIDADCLPEPGAIGRIARLALETSRPVQARNLTDRRPANGPVEAVSIFANRIVNLVRPSGLLRLVAPCRMTGTGMAIPWSLIDEVELAGGDLVEDMRLGIDMAMSGHAPLFCPDAGVTSAMPESDGAFASQRTRWEHGHLSTALAQSPRLLLAAMSQRRAALLAMALDLCIPPMTLLAGIWASLALSCLASWLLGGSWLPAAVLAGGGAAMLLSLATAWAVFCRRQVPLKAFVGVPLYMLRKIPIYARFLFRRQNAWVRTERDAPRTSAPAPHNLGYTLGDEYGKRHPGTTNAESGR